MSKKFAIAAAIVLALGLGFFLVTDKQEPKTAPPPEVVVPPAGEEERTEAPEPKIETILQNLEIPWEITFLPDGEILITERPGRLLKVGADLRVIEVEGVLHRGEGGLLGLALHPEFESNNLLYVYLTAQSQSGIVNRVVRYRLEEDRLFDRFVVLDNIPGSSFHDGGRIAFGPPTPNGSGQADYHLYITTGDAGNADSAQNKNSLAGKILRIRDDGGIPADNPFGNAVYSYGHRNAQGLAWDEEGRLWATEHGRSGILSGYDELNLIEKGTNYGWPVIQGGETRESMRTPILHSGPDVTWAPSGLAYHEGQLFFAGLRGETLYEVRLDEGSKSVREHFKGEFGRLRTAAVGPDGDLYLLTSNRDGRGNISEGDDKVIRIPAEVLK